MDESREGRLSQLFIEYQPRVLGTGDHRQNWAPQANPYPNQDDRTPIFMHLYVNCWQWVFLFEFYMLIVLKCNHGNPRLVKLIVNFSPRYTTLRISDSV